MTSRLRVLALLASLCATLSAAGLTQDPAPKPEPEPDKPVRVELGDPLPKQLVLRDLNGKQVDIGKLRGKVVVLHFWSRSCPSEKVAEPKLNQLALDFGSKGVVVLGVAANQNELGEAPKPEDFDKEDEAARPYAPLRKKAKAVGINHAIVADHGGVLGRMLQAKVTPHCFVFDAEGVLRYEGALDDNSRGEATVPYVRDAVEALLAGEDVPTTSTRPYG